MHQESPEPNLMAVLQRVSYLSIVIRIYIHTGYSFYESCCIILYVVHLSCIPYVVHYNHKALLNTLDMQDVQILLHL